MRPRAALALATALGAAIAAAPPPATAQTRLEMVGFGGASNLPVWVANDRGLFAAEGLIVRLDRTPGSVAQMRNLMAGKYQLATTAADNIVAYTEGQGDVNIAGFDVVAVAGVHSGLNSVVTRPEIRNYADIRGKAVAVDALGTGYAFLLFRILDKNGLKYGKDYTAISVGGLPERLDAMRSNKAVAGLLSAPNDVQAKNMGYNILGDAAAELDGYQGSSYAVRRAWAKDHEAEVVAWVRALIAAHEWIFESRAGSLEVLKKNIKGLSDADAQTIYASLTTGAGGLNRKAEINMAGMRTVLLLRGEFAEPKKNLTDPGKYVDLSFYRKAAGGK